MIVNGLYVSGVQERVTVSSTTGDKISPDTGSGGPRQKECSNCTFMKE